MTVKQAYSKYYLQGSILNKLIIINVVIFIAFLLLENLAFLFQVNLSNIQSWFSFPNDIVAYIKKPWTIITYGFLHSGFRHILWNMLFLYWFAPIFLNIHTGRRFLNVYILGIIFGALSYMLAYALFPAFANNKGSMVGASAAVYAVMVAATVQSPNHSFRLMFIPVNIKLWWICVGKIILDLVSLKTANAGGHFAHLGGAAIGYLYMIQLQKGNDIGAPVENFMDWLVALAKPSDKSKLKTVHNNKKRTITSIKVKNPNQAQIDEILDKISKSGYESLSKKEKEVLFKAGKS